MVMAFFQLEDEEEEEEKEGEGVGSAQGYVRTSGDGMGVGVGKGMEEEEDGAEVFRKSEGLLPLYDILSRKARNTEGEERGKEAAGVFFFLLLLFFPPFEISSFLFMSRAGRKSKERWCV